MYIYIDIYIYLYDTYTRILWIFLSQHFIYYKNKAYCLIAYNTLEYTYKSTHGS